MWGNISGFFNTEPFPLDVVNADTVKTPAGRFKYFKFLEVNNTIPPIKKLYGLKSPENLEVKEIMAHVKKLSVWIHPDKVLYHERDMCEKIFKMVKEAEKQCTTNEKTSHSLFDISLILNRNFINPESQLRSLIEKGKWCQAKEFISKIDKNDYVENPQLVFLVSIVFTRLLDLNSAIECLPPTLSQTKLILQNLKINLDEFSKEQGLSNKFLLVKLNRSLDDLRGLKESSIESDLFDYIVPHNLFVVLKEFYKLGNKILHYEKFLRQAIRYCPDFFQDEKNQLIEELKNHIKEQYSPKTIDHKFDWYNEFKKQGINLCKDFIIQLDQMPKSSYNSYKESEVLLFTSEFLEKAKNTLNYLTSFKLNNIRNWIGLFIEHQVLSYLEDVIEKMQCIVDKSLNVNYSDEIIDCLTPWLHSLKGVKFYLSGDKKLSAHHFLLAKDYLRLGLVQVDLCEYATAIESWGKFENKNALEDNERFSYIFSIMNECDTQHIGEEINYLRQRLGLLDEIQYSAICKNKNQAMQITEKNELPSLVNEKNTRTSISQNPNLPNPSQLQESSLNPSHFLDQDKIFHF
jgi:hypothetical protein